MDAVHGGGAHAHSPDNQMPPRDGSPRGYNVQSELMSLSHSSEVEALRQHPDGAVLYDEAARDRFESLSGAGMSGADSASQSARFDSPEVGGDQGCLDGDGVTMSRVRGTVDTTASTLVETARGLEQSVQQGHEMVADSGLVPHIHGSLSALVNSDFTGLQPAQQLPASSYQMLQEPSVDTMHSDNASAAALDDPGDCDSRYERELREQDRFLPIANVARIMKRNIPKAGKISKEAKECVQECVSEFISFITSEASERCQQEKRKTINGDDILYAMQALGFDSYIEPLKVYLQKYRDFMRGERGQSTPQLDPSQLDRIGDEMEETADEQGTVSGGASTPTGQAYLPPGLMAEHSGSTPPPGATPIFTTQYGVTTQITQAMSY